MTEHGTDRLLRPTHRRDRPRWVTAVFFFMCMVVLLGAFASKNNLLYWFVGMALGAVLAHGFTAGPPMMRVFLGGIGLPETIARGHDAVARVTLVSRNRWRTARGLRIELEFRGHDGAVLLGRAGLAGLSPGETGQVEVSVHADRRGVYELHAVRVVTLFPFGLSSKKLIFEPGGRMVCVPDAASAGRGHQRMLASRVLQRALDVEPADLREYVPGDPRRLIAWRSSARARRLMVRDFESARNRRIWLRCDVPSQDLLQRADRAERVLDRAAAIGREAARHNYSVGVLHEPTGTRVIESGGQRWIYALAELGDRDGVTVGAAPRPDDLILDIPIDHDPGEASDG